jgi:hypothetical protein
LIEKMEYSTGEWRASFDLRRFREGGDRRAACFGFAESGDGNERKSSAGRSLVATCRDDFFLDKMALVSRFTAALWETAACLAHAFRDWEESGVFRPCWYFGSARQGGIFLDESAFVSRFTTLFP